MQLLGGPAAEQDQVADAGAEHGEHQGDRRCHDQADEAFKGEDQQASPGDHTGGQADANAFPQ